MGAGTLAITGAGATLLGLRRMGSMDEYAAAVAATRATLSKNPAILDFVRYASLAASGHNIQPWSFRTGERRIEIFPAAPPRTWRLQPGRADARANSASMTPTTAPWCSRSGRDCTTNPPCSMRSPSASRHVPTDGRPVSAADLKALTTASTVDGVDLVLITDRPQMDRVRDLVIAGNNAQHADQRQRRDNSCARGCDRPRD